MLCTRPGASIPQFYSVPLFEKKNKDLTENVTVVVLITARAPLTYPVLGHVFKRASKTLLRTEGNATCSEV